MLKRGNFLIILTLVLIINYVSALEMSSVNLEKDIQSMGSENATFIISTDDNVRAEVIDDLGDEKLVREFKYGNSFSAELSSEDVIDLVNDERVESISLEKIFHISLQNSVGIINASNLWSSQVSGLNLTGLNQTVCIIDTGINYTHPDLGGCFGSNNPASSCKVIGGYDFVNNDNNPMDDHGHGTHVGGIIAANGTIRGVTPEAKIVAIKALDSSGSATSSQIIAGIEWCVGNSSLLNISVISMSIGDGTNNTAYCNNDNIAPSINAAVAKNISVIVAAGNNGNYTSLSSPACIQNATAVGSTNKADFVSSFSNRNGLMKLFAPGSSINSTYLSGYAVLSGTSMATPHVAGAFLLVNEFLGLTGQTRNPKQIEGILNTTGKAIYDTSSGLNFSRINVYSAVNFLSFNYVNLSYPGNNSITRFNQTFVCNVSSNIQLTNLIFYIWNSTGIENISSSNITGLVNGSSFFYNFTHDENYTWNCKAVNNLSFSMFSSINNSLTSDTVPPGITIVSPLNNSLQSSGKFNVTLNENGTCLYSLDSGINNISMGSLDNLHFGSINDTLNNSVYNLSYYCNDSVGNFNFTNSIFTISTDRPNVTSVSPDDGFSSTGTTTVLFEYNVSNSLNITQCNLILNGDSVALNDSFITNLSNNISYSVSPGNYVWSINCTDLISNVGNSSSKALTINSVSSGGGSGGGGGGGGGGSSIMMTTQTESTEEKIAEGYTKELSKGDTIRFKTSSEEPVNHTITVDYVGDKYVNITIRSNPVKAVLVIGQTIKLNLTSPEYYDLLVKLNSIENGRVSLTLQTIREVIFIQPENNASSSENNNSSLNVQSVSQLKGKENYIVLGIILLVILLIFVYYYNYSRYKKKVAKISKKKNRL